MVARSLSAIARRGKLFFKKAFTNLAASAKATSAFPFHLCALLYYAVVKYYSFGSVLGNYPTSPYTIFNFSRWWSEPVEYRSQVEQIVNTLKKDLPTLFEKDISYDIYSQDIYFQDPVNKFKGKFNYRIIFWTLRFHAKLFFTEIYFDLHDVNQTEPDIILANWTVRGILRLPWKARIFFNGYSTYKLNKDVLIYEHIDTWDRPPSEILKQFIRKGGES